MPVQKGALKMPKKPALKHLKGSTTLSQKIRQELQMVDGVLVTEARNWADVETLIDDYLKQAVIYDSTGNNLLEEIIEALKEVVDLNIIHDEEQNTQQNTQQNASSTLQQSKSRRLQRKHTPENISCASQESSTYKAKLLTAYCNKVIRFLSSSEIKNNFLNYYAKSVEKKKKKEEKEKQAEEQKNANNRLQHQGKMNGYLASERGALEITSELAQGIRQLKRSLNQGEEEEVEIEERKRTRTRILKPAVLSEGLHSNT